MEIVLRLRLIKGSQQAALSALLTYIDSIAQVVGNEGYAVAVDEAQPDVLIIHEFWSDLTRYYAFMNSSLTWGFMANVGPFIEKMEQMEN